jgi:hypothetical protein
VHWDYAVRLRPYRREAVGTTTLTTRQQHAKSEENPTTRKRIFTVPSVLGLVLLAATTHADPLFTPLLVPEGNNQLDCYLGNVSDKGSPSPE